MHNLCRSHETSAYFMAKDLSYHSSPARGLCHSHACPRAQAAHMRQHARAHARARVAAHLSLVICSGTWPLSESALFRQQIIG